MLKTVRQVHGSDVLIVKDPREGRPERGYDALATRIPGAALGVLTADCVPVLLYDPASRAVAAVHAGWAGSVSAIAGGAVARMTENFGSRPADIKAAIGPSIAVCCYEVSEDLAEHFRGRFAAGEEFLVSPPPAEEQDGSMRQPYPPPFLSRTPPGHGPDVVPGPHLNLQAAARYQLLRAGLAKSHIQESGLCTACRTDLFYSHRKEGSHTGRMMAVIGIRPESRRKGPKRAK